MKSTSSRAPRKVRPLSASKVEALRLAINARRFSLRMKAALGWVLEGRTYREAAELAGMGSHRELAKAAAKVPGLREAHTRELLASRGHEPLARLWRRHLARVPARKREESAA